MHRAAILAVALAAFVTAPARADLILSISSPTDLSNLAVGATAMFDISVTGTAADAPGYLSASIQYDPSVFGNPSVLAGPIVPDVSGFDSSGTGGGTATASYDDSIFGTPAITTDGLFYSFTLLRLAAPATSLSFSAFAAMDDQGNVISISTAPDSIDVGAAPNAVPEPSSVMLLLSGLALAAWWRFGRTRRRPLAAVGAR
ncbi:MAG: PEP-CTERM sorting domain-containing protein [Isosphaeraceae bacterium]